MSAVPGQQDRSLSTQIPVISASALPMVRPDEEIGGVDLQLPEREPPPANSRVKEAAWKWMLFYTSEEAQRLLGEWKRGIPSMQRIAEKPGGVFLNPDLPTAE